MKKIKLILIIFILSSVFVAQKSYASGGLQISFPDNTKLQPVPLYNDPNVSGNINWPNDGSTSGSDPNAQPESTTSTNGTTGGQNTNGGTNGGTSGTTNTNGTGGTGNTTTGGSSGGSTLQGQGGSATPGSFGGTSGSGYYSKDGTPTDANSDQNFEQANINRGTWPNNNPNYINNVSNPNGSQYGYTNTNNSSSSSTDNFDDEIYSTNAKQKIKTNYVWPMIYLVGIIVAATALFAFLRSKNK